MHSITKNDITIEILMITHHRNIKFEWESNMYLLGRQETIVKCYIEN